VVNAIEEASTVVRGEIVRIHGAERSPAPILESRHLSALDIVLQHQRPKRALWMRARGVHEAVAKCFGERAVSMLSGYRLKPDKYLKTLLVITNGNRATPV
jgi:hypothetical protein